MLIENTRPNVYIVGATQFMPGVNHVLKTEWEKIKAHPHVKENIEMESIKIHAAEDAKEGEMNTLKEFQPKVAEKIVRATFSETLLLSWEADEKRGPVKTTIRAQLKFIEIGTSKESQESNNSFNS